METMRVLAKNVHQHDGKPIVVCGWVHRRRELGAVVFLILRDRSGMVQIVCDKSEQASVESVLKVSGTVKQNERAMGGFEIHAETVSLLSAPQAELPLSINEDPGKLTLDTILDNRIVSLRNPKLRDVFRLESVILECFSSYLRSQDFVEIKSSKLIGSETEGGSGLFTVEYFDKKVYLAQSPQFYKQAMVASGLERVFECAPAYRAEKHDTGRHLNEYVSLDVEMGYIKDEHDLMDLEVDILASIFNGAREQCQSVLDAWGATVPTPEQLQAIPRLDYDEAREIVKKRSGASVFEISPQAERELCEWALETHNTELVFVCNFPRRKRPFYTYPEGKGTRSFDLLFRGLEITTGGQRIHDFQELRESARIFGLEEQTLADYFDIFKYACPPHGGFALGLERVAQKILGLQSVKEAALFPRDRKRIRP